MWRSESQLLERAFAYGTGLWLSARFFEGQQW